LKYDKMKENLKSGKVYLVGAGPGDPGLLTLKAYQTLQECEVLIYDALVNPEIVNYAPQTAEKIFIGASRGHDRIRQKEVEDLMILRASQGHSVVRLKGGDPFMFGRGGEEAETLMTAGIEWEVIPGISAGMAVPAYAGIPLTHRDYASSVIFITGHECIKKSALEWDKIRYTFNTLVVFMGATNIKKIVNNLLKSNYKPSLPIAVIERGTTREQKVRTATLANIIENVAANPIQTPALIIIGEVVKFREKLGKQLPQEWQELIFEHN
jgi:uroporphyrin-III C-methyltransferase